MIPGQVLLYRRTFRRQPIRRGFTDSVRFPWNPPGGDTRGTAPVSPPYYMAAMKNILDTRYAERISSTAFRENFI
jgi:hypothetical protein